jgi:RES domain-containing protein
LSTIIWRIENQRHAATPFSGIGAQRFGGRWNSVGMSMVYSSATLSLSALEKFVHMELKHMGKQHLVSFNANIPDDVGIEQLSLSQLPQDWQRNAPYHPVLAQIGDKWLTKCETAVLIVPSAIIPQEYNYLLNPEHPDFSKIKIEPSEPFRFDNRLWKKPIEEL